MSLETSEDTNVQIKSRMHEQGDFPPWIAAGHIVDAWLAGRRRSNPPKWQWLVFEGAIETAEPFDELGRPLRLTLSGDSRLAEALRRRLPGTLSDLDLESLLDSTSVYCATWTEIEAQTDAHLAHLPNSVDLAGRQLVTRSLLIDIARATVDNAASDATQRTQLDRSAILQGITAVQELIDVQGLNEALRTGLCSFVDWGGGAAADDRFYEGESTQPGHVAAGMVIERSDLVDQVVEGVAGGNPVLLTGPSGIGKSAVLWTVPQALPGVAWFRVDRLRSDDDANLILRLTRAYDATAEHPIGLLIDGVGTGEILAWDALRSRVASSSGTFLIGTVRNEDLPQVGDLRGALTIDVSLDETSAEAIFEGLRRRDATDSVHWREAYEFAEGLTLEFTYLLTQGRRLRDVIDDQVRRRIFESRFDEIELLSLVALAHQWGASLTLNGLAAANALPTTSLSLRSAIDRLADEHLLVETDGALRGLHPVRSAAITESIHSRPPPILASTFAAVLRSLTDDALASFIVTSLRDRPDLASLVIDTGGTDAPTSRRLAAYLQGLRLFDSELGLRNWISILEEEGVKRSSYLIVILLALVGSDLGPSTPAPIASALRRMKQAQVGDQRNRLADSVGSSHISRLLFESSLGDASVLLATLFGWAEQVAVPDDVDSSGLIAEMSRAPLASLREALATFFAHDPDLGEEILRRLGGDEKMLELINKYEPWLLSAELVESAEGRIGRARLLHVDEEIQGSAREQCVALASTFNRLFPSMTRPDVEARWPGDREIRLGDYSEASSRLSREHDHGQTALAWNVARQALARRLLGVPDTLRLHAAAPVVRDLGICYREVCSRWIRGVPAGPRDSALRREVVRLREAGYALPPGIGNTKIDLGAIDKAERSSISDEISMAITNLTDAILRLARIDNMTAFAMFVSDQVVKHVKSSLDEPWFLIPDGEEVVDSLQEIIEISEGLVAIVSAMALDDQSARKVRRHAKNGPPRQAFGRAAALSRQLMADRLEARSAEIGRVVSTTLSGWPIVIRASVRGNFSQFALVIEVPSLFAWMEHSSDVEAALHSLNGGLERYLVVPTVGNRRFDGVGFTFINTALPYFRAEDWEELPEAHEAGLAVTLRSGLRALQVLSGIGDLSLQGRGHPDVQAAAEEMNRLLSECVESLRERDDQFASYAADCLFEIAERIQQELDGSWNGPTYAAAIAAGISGDATEELSATVALNLCALTWSVDQQIVRELLGLTEAATR